MTWTFPSNPLIQGLMILGLATYVVESIQKIRKNVSISATNKNKLW